MTERLLVGLPKGRLFDRTLALLARAGVQTDQAQVGSRRLTFTDAAGLYDFVSLKPTDVPVYVESGAVDLGVVGSDILREQQPDVYEPLDLQIGKCRLVVAAPVGAAVAYSQYLRVATKYPRTAERFFLSKNARVQIVRLEGSVEIAPLLGLANALVDLVETGRTLQENGMRIVEEVEAVSAKLIVNRAAMKTKSLAVNRLLEQLDAAVYENS